MNSKGFTLLEILIAVTILAIISTLTAMNISRSVKFKNKIEQDLDDYSSVRDALIIITHDINTAFHWVDINAEIKKELSAPNASPGTTPLPTQPPAAPPGEVVPIEKLTSFEGENDSLYLTTLSHVRTTMNTKESDQAKIGYFLKEVKSLHLHEPTKALIRSESPVLDGESKKNLVETVLLENVKEFKLTYLGGDDKEWKDSWKSIDNDDVTQKNNFPDAVEITITTNRKGREISLSTMASIHSPNNDLLKNLTGAGTGGGGTPGASPSPGATPPPTPPPLNPH